MSLTAESSPPPSASPTSQSSAPAAGAEGQVETTTIGSARETRPPDAPATRGDNGGPDWRAMVAGEDAKGIEELSRYKTPAEFLKSFREQRAALSKRAEAPKLADNATPEQVAEYRKAIGMPEVAADAKPDDIMKAFGIKAPEGYELNDIEKGMLGEWAKLSNGKHIPPGIAREAVDFLFKHNTAVQQAQRKADADIKKEWTTKIRDELGKDYEPLIASANDYLAKALPDDNERAAFVNARLPGGGLLGDHPLFVKMVSDLATQNGFTDRIETQSMESGGKSLQQQQQEIEALRMTNRELYNSPATQERLKKVISLRMGRKEIDEFGNERRRA